MTIETDANDILEGARRIEAESFDCRDLEPYFLKFLQLVKGNPEHRGFFVELFTLIATSKLPAPSDLVPYCMRELRYPEVKSAVQIHMHELRVQNLHARYMNYCSHVTRAYDDFVWEDAILWTYYSSKELTAEAVPLLIERLSLADSDAQFNALMALESIGPVASSAIPSIRRLRQLSPKGSNVFNRAGLALKAIEQDSEIQNTNARNTDG
jgi:hypothetical protein